MTLCILLESRHLLGTQLGLLATAPMSESQVYDNPLVTRYAGRQMAELWGPQRKFSTWRRLWVALAEAERELGLTAADGVSPRITPEQLDELRGHIHDIDFGRADALER